MSEYCHHCGTTISEDIATLCPLCASKPDSLRREEIDEFAAKLKTGAIPAQIVDGKPMKNTNDIVRQLLDLCERANTVMLGDTKHDGGEPEDNWIADYEAILDEAQCAAGIHLYSTNWKSGKAYDYCPFCGHEPNSQDRTCEA